jgi:hypothetical protein
MQIFHNDDAGYRAWLAAHPDGFVLNVPLRYRTGNEVWLHRGSCRVIARPSPYLHHTRDALKVCSPDAGAITHWAVAQDYVVLSCGFCGTRQP